MDHLVSFMHAISSCTHNFGKSFCCLIWCQYIEYLVSLCVSYLQQLVSVMVEMNEASGFTRDVSDNALGLTNVFNKCRF